MMYYLFTFSDKITVEFRVYNPGDTGEPNAHAWALRNHFWGTSGPRLGADIEEHFDVPTVRYSIFDDFNGLWRFQLEHIVKSDYTIPTDQIIRYPPQSDDSRYTFSLFALPKSIFRRHSRTSWTLPRPTTTLGDIAPICSMSATGSRRTDRRCCPIPGTATS